MPPTFPCCHFGRLTTLNSFLSFVFSPGFVGWLSLVVALGGSSVAGRSHELDCTAASGSGADQGCSLPDSPGRPCAAKSAPMAC